MVSFYFGLKFESIYDFEFLFTTEVFFVALFTKDELKILPTSVFLQKKGFMPSFVR